MIPTGRFNDVFFPDEGHEIQALADAQAICARCPVFQDCTRWTLANYPNLEFGIFAGLTPSVREKLWNGDIDYYDWRQDWAKRWYVTHRAQLRAKRLLEAGQGKRAQAKANMPVCPHCGQNSTVCRNGTVRNKQRYRCTDCNKNFSQEE
jgi:predicted RNA-binding Zn-ribbon protein involved in translation (DUF1610 family)